MTATAQTRAERIAAQEPAGRWRGYLSDRSQELDEILDSLDLDDGVVATDAAPSHEVASQVLDAAGWWVPGAENLAQ